MLKGHTSMTGDMFKYNECYLRDKGNYGQNVAYLWDAHSPMI